MEECTGHSGDYLTYPCYTRLNYYLNKTVTLSKENEEKLKNVVSNMTYRDYNIKSIPFIFKKIGTFLTGDYAFGYIGQEPSCIYVNYWLNKELRTLYYNEGKHQFDVFKDFSDKFTIKRGKNISNSCRTYMEFYDDVKWNRIKFLYEWYEKFEKYIYYSKHKSESQCSEITILRKEFNDFIDKNNEEEKLMDKLIKFKDLLPKNLSEINRKCKDEKDYFHYPPKHLQKLEQQRRAAEQEAQEQQRRAAEQEAQEQQRRAAEQQRAQSQSHERTLLTISPNGEPTQQLIDISIEDPLLEKHSSPLERSQSQRHEYSEGQEFRDSTQFTSNPLRQDQRILEYTEVRNMELENENMPPDFKPGVFGTLRNTFTGVLGEIDPVPVVGVSGGMGALFLLFRYTPVGAFFRGGRGRAHRIPRSFNGQFLGGFPGYEDYDVGHIGYGPMNPLAE
ncbi:VIR protein [Plasmodium vivax]|uniref:VIR protein n=1 Tax=Plasmodium vivax TaxID=5855 RepID=A0A1G4E1C9_PLAVI|nr:VIR protein [Plasmodium vivax]